MTDTQTQDKAPALAVGDRVLVNHPGYDGRMFVVEKLPTGAREVNAVVRDPNTRQGLRVRPSVLLPEGTERPEPDFTYAPPTGTVVTVEGSGKIDPRVYYVVLKPGHDTASIARLGGSDGDRYYPKVPVRWLRHVRFNEETHSF